LKQILDLLWHLILRYQVSKINHRSKTLMCASLVDYTASLATLKPSNAFKNSSNAMAKLKTTLVFPKTFRIHESRASCPGEVGLQKPNVTNVTTDWVNSEALGLLVNVVSASAFPAYMTSTNTQARKMKWRIAVCPEESSDKVQKEAQ